MRISDWSSDVCSSDRALDVAGDDERRRAVDLDPWRRKPGVQDRKRRIARLRRGPLTPGIAIAGGQRELVGHVEGGLRIDGAVRRAALAKGDRSEEHTSELQSLMRISYAVFCLKYKKEYQNYNAKDCIW